MSALFDRYRPKTWGEVIAQEKAVESLRRLVATGEALGQAVYIIGGRGTGKSTIAQLFARDVADDYNIEERDSDWLTPARMDELERSLRYRPIGSKSGRAILVNESHRLRPEAIGRFLTWLERLPPWVVIIFTIPPDKHKAFVDADDDNATFFSRCFPVELSQRGLAEAFAKRAQEIAVAENLNGKPLESYVRLLKECRNNFRMALQKIQAGYMLAQEG
jgi:DNA polymerase III delta prime subunit